MLVTNMAQSGSLQGNKIKHVGLVLIALFNFLSLSAFSDVKVVANIQFLESDGKRLDQAICAYCESAKSGSCRGNCPQSGVGYIFLVKYTESQKYYLVGHFFGNTHQTMTYFGKVVSIYGGEFRYQGAHTRASVNSGPGTAGENAGLIDFRFTLPVEKVENKWVADFEHVRQHKMAPGVKDNFPDLTQDPETLPIVNKVMSQPITGGLDLDKHLGFLKRVADGFIGVEKLRSPTPHLDLEEVFNLCLPHLPVDLEAADESAVLWVQPGVFATEKKDKDDSKSIQQ